MEMQEVRDLLPRYADGELDAEQSAAVEAAVAAHSGLQDELKRWQGLRRSANRGLTDIALPADLQGRITASIRREQNRSRIMQLIVPLSAVAAVVTLAIVLQGSLFSSQRVGGGGVATASLVASDFVRIHENCAVMKKHDPYNVRQQTDISVAVADAIKCNTGVNKLPRLAGYASTGCCDCIDPGRRVKGIHVFYEADGQAVVSLFVTDGLVQLLKDAQTEPSENPEAYQLMEFAKTGLVKWNEKAHSYAVVARMQPGELKELANQLRVAGWMNSCAPLAMTQSRW